MVKQSPLISVIIPTFNRAMYITKAIDSISQQSFSDYEIIVIDDGSTDNTKKELNKYKNSIKYFYQENRGVSSARNRGIREAKGKWIAFLDSDDEWLPHKLFHQIKCLNQTGVKVCFTNAFFRVRDNEKKMETISEQKDISWDVFQDPFDFILYKNKPTLIQTLIIERALLDDVGLFNEDMSVAEDTHLIYRLAFKTPFAYINQPLIFFNRIGSMDRLTGKGYSSIREQCLAATTILFNAFSIYINERDNKRNIKRFRRLIGYFLSSKAVIFCIEKKNMLGS